MGRFLVLSQQALEQQAGDKPARGIVQADHLRQVPFGALVVPRTQVAFLKPHSGYEFTGKYHAGINQAAKYEVAMTHDAAQRRKHGCESVDGEHPDGSGARKAEISPAKSVKCGKYHFEEPAQQPAMYIVVNPFFHIMRISRLCLLYTE